ncbi:MAG: ankyrin repeat domain-containing protein, partial [Treponema sp.]|nr:ankyrin repeat domain-containing protein [Treponema sp.]
VNVNARDHAGETPLYHAAMARKVEIAKYLVSKGADVNARTSYGWTILRSVDTPFHMEIQQFLRSVGGVR